MEALTDPQEVAEALTRRSPANQTTTLVPVVSYEPGNGTRYDLAYVSLVNGPWAASLICLNGGWMIRLRNGGMFSANEWCVTRSVYPGDWAAIRPVLACMGWAQGGRALTWQADALRETDLRAHGYDGEPINGSDAKLGRLVKRAVKDWREGVPDDTTPRDTDGDGASDG